MKKLYKTQKGSSLLFTLIILVAMLFGTISLFKSVNMSTVVAGNLAFKESSINAADVGLSKAFDKLSNPAFDLNTSSTTGEGLYYITQRKVDNNGIVCATLANTDDDTDDGTLHCKKSDMLWGTATIVGNNQVFYVIDRLCSTSLSGISSSDIKTVCLMDTNSTNIGGSNCVGNLSCENKAPLSLSYRVTVRVVGTNNTESFVQTTLSQPLQII